MRDRGKLRETGTLVKQARVDNDQLSKIMNRLGDAAVDPAAWPEIMDSICRAAGASAAVLLQSDIRTPDVPRTASIDEALRLYFADNWHLVDPRARGFPRMMAGDVVSDQDILTPEQIRADPMYNEILYPFGFKWFAGIGFRAGAAAWALTIQRTGREGPFEALDKHLLARLAPRLTETASLATAIGRVVISSTTDALNHVQKPAIVLSNQGLVLNMNAAAEAGFDEDIRVRNRQLMVRDKQALAKLEQLVDLIRATPDSAALPAEPILIRRTIKPPVTLRVLPIDGAARNVFLGARALLVFSNLLPAPAPEPTLIAQAFGLTPAESRLAALIGSGLSVDVAAAQLRISRETARNHLKSTFSKTGTHRQQELISIIIQLTR